MIKYLVRMILNIIFTALLLYAVDRYSPGWLVVESQKYDIFLTFGFLSVVFFVLNTILKKILNIITLPLRVITLGLFSVVLNITIIYIFKYIVNMNEIDFGMKVQVGNILQVTILSFFLMIPNILSKLFK